MDLRGLSLMAMRTHAPREWMVQAPGYEYFGGSTRRSQRLQNTKRVVGLIPHSFVAQQP